MEKLQISDSRQNVHTYTIDWQPDQLTWAIDGQVMRTLKKSDTWNETSNSFHYPQTPSRIQLSLWPAGLSSNGQGTIEWAGGLVNWDSPYMQNGYYYAMVSDVNVECYNPPSGWNNDFGTNAYYYLSDEGTNNTVAIGNNDTILASFLASGNNPNYNPNAKASGSSTMSGSKPTNTPQTVPGISGGGNVASSGQSPVDTGADGSSSSSSSSSTSNSGSGSSAAGSSSGFTQGQASDGTSEAAPRIVAGSVVALLGFFAVALML